MSNIVGTLCRNFRDIETISPRVLLIGVFVDGVAFRDHVWVPKLLFEGFIPKNNKKKIKVAFEAEATRYLSSYGYKDGLTKIKNVRLAGNSL